ncbi:unnamed protein product, partial [Symbiodinium microadriaticum]
AAPKFRAELQKEEIRALFWRPGSAEPRKQTGAAVAVTLAASPSCGGLSAAIAVAAAHALTYTEASEGSSSSLDELLQQLSEGREASLDHWQSALQCMAPVQAAAAAPVVRQDFEERADPGNGSVTEHSLGEALKGSAEALALSSGKIEVPNETIAVDSDPDAVNGGAMPERTPEWTYFCRKCGAALFHDLDVLQHQRGGQRQAGYGDWRADRQAEAAAGTKVDCTSLFVQPMKREAEGDVWIRLCGWATCMTRADAQLKHLVLVLHAVLCMASATAILEVKQWLEHLPAFALPAFWLWLSQLTCASANLAGGDHDMPLEPFHHVDVLGCVVNCLGTGKMKTAVFVIVAVPELDEERKEAMMEQGKPFCTLLILGLSSVILLKYGFLTFKVLLRPESLTTFDFIRALAGGIYLLVWSMFLLGHMQLSIWRIKLLAVSVSVVLLLREMIMDFQEDALMMAFRATAGLAMMDHCQALLLQSGFVVLRTAVKYTTSTVEELTMHIVGAVLLWVIWFTVQTCLKQFLLLTQKVADAKASLEAVRALLSSQCDAEACLSSAFVFQDPSSKLAHFLGCEVDQLKSRSLDEFLAESDRQ